MSVRFQPYTIGIVDSHSAGGFVARQLITFPSLRRKFRFIRYVRCRCRARRRGDWIVIPGHTLILRAMTYAARHWSYVYNLPLRREPAYSVDETEDNLDSEVEDCVQPLEDHVAEEELDENHIVLPLLRTLPLLGTPANFSVEEKLAQFK
ncbi:hypothetical protein BDN70DRAFT_894517 [Pholiota conissans]|uniref:Uncharacterized protein n=1 Tax=Pholiota conissans TaxID=109636 RepID=A0A9P6D155_9AGAR|nr:hypothetical protein BDN70DRAFT_894517 [Pholiota conissans]